MLPVNNGGHSAYQSFVVENLHKYYPNPDALDRLWDSDPAHLSPQEHPLRGKNQNKQEEKGTKADSVEKVTVAQLFDTLESPFVTATGIFPDSESDLPVFPLLNPASKHDSHGFLEAYFQMNSFLPDYHVKK